MKAVVVSLFLTIAFNFPQSQGTLHIFRNLGRKVKTALREDVSAESSEEIKGYAEKSFVHEVTGFPPSEYDIGLPREVERASIPPSFGDSFSTDRSLVQETSEYPSKYDTNVYIPGEVEISSIPTSGGPTDSIFQEVTGWPQHIPTTIYVPKEVESYSIPSTLGERSTEKSFAQEVDDFTSELNTTPAEVESISDKLTTEPKISTTYEGLTTGSKVYKDDFAYPDDGRLIKDESQVSMPLAAAVLQTPKYVKKVQEPGKKTNLATGKNEQQLIGRSK